MSTVFSRRYFTESPTLLFFMALSVFMQFSNTFLVNLLVTFYGILLFTLCNAGFKAIMVFIPKTIRYPTLFLIAVTLMTLSYHFIQSLWPYGSANFYLFFAFFNAMVVLISSIDYGYYQSALAGSVTLMLALTLFLALFLTLALILNFLLSGSLSESLTFKMPFWHSLAGRLLVLATLMAFLKILLKRES